MLSPHPSPPHGSPAYHREVQFSYRTPYLRVCLSSHVGPCSSSLWSTPPFEREAIVTPYAAIDSKASHLLHLRCPTKSKPRKGRREGEGAEVTYEPGDGAKVTGRGGIGYNGGAETATGKRKIFWRLKRKGYRVPLT
ncbi:hypothetical protein B296_00032440 [Ensete ventricosum]|uniref:Uncharacterized protein n=1 Tax=Ensete ventricosum TaxID=4639 RepID=A0A426ZHA8_ENSVE|nr:hypothetical protein B296_00032440 [Ensete ventricosum]